MIREQASGFRTPILALGRLDRDNLRLHFRRQTVISNQDIVDPIRMIFARPARRI